MVAVEWGNLILTNQRLVCLNRVALSEQQAERIKEGCIIDSQKMASQPCCDLKIKFDEGRNHSQGLKIPFTRITSLLEKCDRGCV